MFANTLRLHVVHNGGTVDVKMRRQYTTYRVTLNGVTRDFGVSAIRNMTEENFLQILQNVFNVNTENLPHLEMGGKRKSPPPLGFYGLRKRGRPRKNTQDVATQNRIINQELEIDEEKEPDNSAVDDLIEELV